MTERRLASKGAKQEDARVWPEFRDNLANLQLLQGGPNKAKSDADFDDWLNREFPDATKRGYFLAMHHFPIWKEFQYSAFGPFLKERDDMLLTFLEKELT
jgi:hypothetical protein